MTEYAGGKNDFYIRSRPKKYPMTDQQKKLIEIVDECGIHKGITKKELQIQMVNCVGPKMRETKKKT